jgi:hypothetical protein
MDRAPFFFYHNGFFSKNPPFCFAAKGSKNKYKNIGFYEKYHL